jgi:hypothetical protein
MNLGISGFLMLRKEGHQDGQPDAQTKPTAQMKPASQIKPCVH